MPLKVVTSEEMAKLETLSEKEGVSPKELMAIAGKRIADYTAAFIEQNEFEKRVYLLVGKGNNGGDALTAGIHLFEAGFEIVAILAEAEESLSHLASEAKTIFLSLGGKVYPFPLIRSHRPTEGVILDGLFGTGFKGTIRGPYQEIILYANQSGLPILSIDIASGIGGEGIPVEASMTLSLGFPKVASYLGEGWDFSGIIQNIPIGIPEAVLKSAEPLFTVVEKSELPPLLPKIYRSRHKYERGYVGIIAGSSGMSGSAFLTALGAFRGGAGIVHLYTDESLLGAFYNLPQLIVKPLSTLKDVDKYDVLVVGPGMGREAEKAELLQEIMPEAKQLVLDGDALYHIAEKKLKIPPGAILTPHHGELERLLGEKFPKRTLEWLHKASKWALDRSLTLLAKGGPTFLFGEKMPRLIPFGDPGMATAGAGDLLSGIIGALVSEGLSAHNGALLGASLHGIAGELAAQKVTSYAMHVGDIAENIPAAFEFS